MLKKKKLTGTARYASIHALEAYEQSRRDDLESVGYVLMYFLRGDLPWQGLKVRSKEDRYKKILEKKKDTSSEELCKNFPQEFLKYVDYTKNLEYEETPDYDMLRQLFLDVVSNLKEKMDYIYDWTTNSDLQKRKETKKKDKEDTDSEKESTNEKKNKKRNNKSEEIESNHEQNDKNHSQIRRDDVKEDKVESVCCHMYVHIIYNFHFNFTYSF